MESSLSKFEPLSLTPKKSYNKEIRFSQVSNKTPKCTRSKCKLTTKQISHRRKKSFEKINQKKVGRKRKSTSFDSKSVVIAIKPQNNGVPLVLPASPNLFNSISKTSTESPNSYPEFREAINKSSIIDASNFKKNSPLNDREFASFSLKYFVLICCFFQFSAIKNCVLIEDHLNSCMIKLSYFDIDEEIFIACILDKCDFDVDKTFQTIMKGKNCFFLFVYFLSSSFFLTLF